MTSSSIQYTRTDDGVNIAFATRGEGVALIVVPGWVSNVENSVAATTVFPGYMTVHFDKRGTGLSDRDLPDYSLEARVRDLEAVVEALAPERLVLWGASEGGPIAIQYTATNRGRVLGLILEGTYARGDVFRPDVHEAILALTRAEWGLAAQTLTSMFAPGATSEEVAVFSKLLVDGATQEDAIRLWAEIPQIDVSGLLGDIDCPTLVIHRRGDRISPFESGRELAGRIPNARLAPIDSDRHWDPASRDTLREIAGEFLQELSAARTSRRAGGFAAILFTDVVSSTPLLSQLKDERMRAVMRDHDAICEAAITEHGGRVVKTIGDAFMAEFSVPSAAIEAAIAIQRGVREQFADSDVPIRLRIGINAGEPIVEDDDLHGASVVIAKRLESEADEGGILVSEVVRQAVAGKDFEFEDRGEVELKGFDQPVRAWTVRWSE